jgi:TPR repeat protein
MGELNEAITAYEAKDYAKARALCSRLAERGESHARYLLGLMHSQGQGGPPDTNEAFRLYRLAAEAGHTVAQYCVGALYAQGRGIPQDYQEALRWYRKAAGGGDADALFKLGVMYANGQGTPKNFAEARQWWVRAAEKGQAEAMLFLGHLYAHGDGCERDPVIAAQWYMKAWQADNTEAKGLALALVPELVPLADRGLAAAQNILGVIYKFLTNKDVEAMRLLEQASAQGDCEAIRLLAYCYEQGEGVEKDSRHAAQLYREAAERGDKFAQFNLGVFYAGGLGGLPWDLDVAIHWYRKAADQNLIEAFQPLAELLARRNRDKNDAREALQRLHAVAEAGPANAEYRLESADGRWSVIIKQQGAVVALSGITMEELDEH